ncbi:phosphonate ABC transporter, permease protein PhnE [Rhodovarius crocodyli]|uniref:Phosphonate ABC transporter, permease protein PhnE n=1 Tax=Rhodovarius crocodyli TaxID=1979269 RepID=A0A437MMU9_9PROT|nr:phosphonate ABC transporter, permease protein PhnE [Rhodovarius crocodyli]RVT98974.1 phosphonate ABC transporter, permease protein PhnE [Rhodovarius crocodyli]
MGIGYADSGAITSLEAAFRAQRAERRRASVVALAILAVCLVAAAWVSEFYPSTLIAGVPRIGEYFHRIAPTLDWRHLFGGVDTDGSLAAWFYRLDSWVLLLLETANMAALGTLGGVVLALPLAFPAARNLGAPNPIRIACRRLLEAMRTVPEIVFALIFVWAFGVGALAGILAIALHTAGALGKLFADAMENVEMRPWEGVHASGGSWFQACRYAVLPAALPDLLSTSLLRFEINIRSASVIGFVGAGGIGEELYQVISFNYYEEISAIVVLLIVTVSLVDLLSEKLRRRVIEAVS